MAEITKIFNLLAHFPFNAEEIMDAHIERIKEKQGKLRKISILDFLLL